MCTITNKYGYRSVHLCPCPQCTFIDYRGMSACSGALCSSIADLLQTIYTGNRAGQRALLFALNTKPLEYLVKVSRDIRGPK